MKIISGFRHPGTPGWNDMLDGLQESAKRFNHSIEIAAIPTKDDWITKYYELYLSLCWKYKIMFMMEELERLNDDLIWIDGDCLIAKPIDFEEAMSGCDVGFTLRDIKDRHNTSVPVCDGYINSGVVFLRNNAASRSFMEQVKKELMLSLYDQEAFNKVILRTSNMEKHDEIILNCAGRASIKMLNCREYNNFYFDSTTQMAKIIHFKSQGRALYHKFKEAAYHV